MITDGENVIPFYGRFVACFLYTSEWHTCVCIDSTGWTPFVICCWNKRCQKVGRQTYWKVTKEPKGHSGVEMIMICFCTWITISKNKQNHSQNKKRTCLEFSCKWILYRIHSSSITSTLLFLVTPIFFILLETFIFYTILL